MQALCGVIAVLLILAGAFVVCCLTVTEMFSDQEG